MLGVVLCVRCSCVRVSFSFSRSGALREVTLSRTPLRRPVCSIPKGSHSSHRPDVCLHPCVQLGGPESCSPRQADLSTHHEHSTLAVDLCSRSPCSSTLLPGVVFSTRQVTDPACYWIAHSQVACYGTEIALLATGFVVQCATELEKECHPVCYWFHSLRQCPPFNGCFM